MDLSPKDRRQLLELIAKNITQRIEQGTAGDLAELVLLPLQGAAAQLSLSPKQARRVLPVCRLSSGRIGVSLANIRRHIAGNTDYPADWTGPRLSPETQPTTETQPCPSE